MAKNMSAIISTLGALLQTVPSNTSTSMAFFHDLLQLYIPVGGHIELRAPIGDIPQVLSLAAHQPQRGTITVSVGERRNPIPKEKLQILLVESEEALLKLNRTGNAVFTPLAESRVITLLPPGYSSEKVSMALALCWRSSFGTCLTVLQPDRAVGGVYDFYYSPLQLRNNIRCTSQHAVPAHINRWVYGKGFQHKHRTSQPIIRDFQGCIILIAPNYVQPYFFHKCKAQRQKDLDLLSHFDGLDPTLLSIIAEKYNMTVRVLSQKMLHRLAEHKKEEGEGEDIAQLAANGSDAFIALLENHADIVAGGFVPTEWRFKTMHVTRAYARDVLMWYAPAYEDDSWVRLTVCFSTSVWILLGLSFCATAALRLLVASKENDPHPIMTLWSLWTESGQHPKYCTASEVLLGVIWIIFSLHVNSAYRAGLATSMAAGPLYDDITVEELYTSDFTLILPTALEGIVGDLLHEHRGQRLRCSSNKVDCIAYLRQPKNIALLVSANYMIMEVPIHLMNTLTGLPLVRTVQGNVLTYPIQMFMSKGHILRPAFDETLQKITDAGFPMRYMSMAMWKATRKRTRKKDDEGIPLTFSHLQGAFALLCAGLTTAILVAVCETLVWKSVSSDRPKTNIRLCFQSVNTATTNI